MLFLRRLRGVIGTAVTWGTSWAAVGLALGSIALRFVPPGVLPADALLQTTMRWGILGAVSGASFAIALSLAEKQRAHAVDELTGRRVAWWGAVGGAVLPAAVLPFVALTLPAALIPALFLVPVGSALGAVSAATSLRLARRAQRLAPSGDVDFHSPPA
jgi:hypothetical protein